MSVDAQWPLVAMEIQSSVKTENYGWMKDLPGVREWIGQRVVHNLESANYQLTNKDWEFTIGVDRNDIADDSLGIYRNRFNMQGEVVARHPDQLVWETLLAGFATTGLDGQYFFDTDHVSYNAAKAEISYSNTGGGAGAPWFLMDLSRGFMKPMVMQKRQEFQFVNLDRPEDENVFMNKQFMYGADGRYAVGFGFHQLAYGSKATLDAAAYEAARVAMGTQRRPDGSVLSVSPTHLIVGPTNEGAARDVVGVSNLASGATNKWWKTAKIVVVPQLG